MLMEIPNSKAIIFCVMPRARRSSVAHSRAVSGRVCDAGDRLTTTPPRSQRARHYTPAVDEVRQLNEDDLRAWWTHRFTALAAEADEEIRIASLIAALRSLSQLDPAERRRLTRARMRAAIALPPATRDLVFATRALAAKREPALDADDNSVVAELIPTIPEAAGFRPPAS